MIRYCTVKEDLAILFAMFSEVSYHSKNMGICCGVALQSYRGAWVKKYTLLKDTLKNSG